MLWDIDGTLVRTGEIGAVVFDRALATVLGAPPSARVRMSGKTDPQIVREYLEQMGIEEHGVLESILAEAEAELAKLADRLSEEGTACPGVREVLKELAGLPHVVQSVLTGNLEPNAIVKLSAFGLDRYVDFSIGAFGSDDADRTRLVPVALARAAALRDLVFDPGSVWVIGDTPNDLACAQAGGVRCLLVATGRYTYDELAELGADAVFSDLTDLDAVLGVLAS